MSQRECAGFNRPFCAVAAKDPFGVFPITKHTAFGNSDTLCAAAPARPLASAANGVGHPRKIKPLSDVRTAEARSAQIARPKGVVRAFHVSRYKIEPIERACNLLSNKDWRAALADKVEPGGPEMSLVGKAFLLACAAKGLAGTASRPDGTVICPSGLAQGVTPYANSRKEVALVETRKVFMLNFRNAPLINFTFCQMSRRY